jgi:hypothetical protein
MVKIFQLLTVFILLMLVVTWFFRREEDVFREYAFLYRTGSPLGPEISLRLLFAVVEEDFGVLQVFDEQTGLVFRWRPEGGGMLEIVDAKNGEIRQSLAVPTGITTLALDPEDKELYVGSEGSIYVFAPSGARG